ncbi:MAG: alpha/beta hydrolase [Planctomycetes bacterium]|nr:alpha/beta hydrolase [Planctomycetota bacterium]
MFPALILAIAPQFGVPMGLPQVDRSRLHGPRDATPFARTLEESAGPGWERERALSLAPGASARGGVGVGVRAFTGLNNAPPPGSIVGRAGVPGVTPTPRWFEVTIQPGTGFGERFLVQDSNGIGPRPVLVVFHKFGVSHYDGLLNTSFFAEARRRNWICIAPLSGGQTHFSDSRSHIHTRAVLQWVRSSLSVDTARVYAVGFSMGGGAAMNYAARQLDPTHLMIAAVFNQSGILSHEDTYPQSGPTIQQIYDDRFGNGLPGSATPWNLQRGSVFSFDPNSLVVAATDLGRNLLHLATHTTRTTGDIPYLITQNDLFHQHQLGRGASATRHLLSVVNYPGHSWDAVSEASVCNWLRNYSLALPSAANTLADANGRFFHFHIEQALAGDFTPFNWSVDTINNAVAITGTANLTRARVATADAGLDPLQPLSVTTGCADGLPDQILLEGYVQSPSAVLRDGVSTLNWSHDAQLGRLVLDETDGGATHVWSIVP